ncbi:MAG: YigZ family protein [Bacillota bacterium]|nr:YigZ family protein [Bacillota bacterium]
MYSYKTIAAPVRSKITVGACRFFASLSYCEKEDEARSFLEQVKEELTGATHHAWAFRLGLGEKMLERCDDAGEPAGTAGPPMLTVLEKEDLTNLIVVGTRYFGGVKLGVGGLIRAYRSCAEAGVNASRICTRELKETVLLEVPYDYLGPVVREIEAAGGETQDFRYGDHVKIVVTLTQRKMDGFHERIADASRGKAAITIAKISNEQ